MTDQPLDWVDIAGAIPDIIAFNTRIGARVFQPLPAVPFIAQTDFDAMAQGASVLMQAQARLAARIVAQQGQQALLDRLTFPSAWTPFIDWDKLGDASHRICRLDMARTASGPKFLEFNVFCGVGGPDVHTPYAAAIDALGRADLGCGKSPFVHLADYYARLIAAHDLQRIALVDWSAHGAKGYPDFSELHRYLSARLPDVPISIHDERDYPSEWLTPGAGRGTLIHRVFTAGDLAGDMRFLQALKDSGAHLSSGLEAELLMDKGWLALLWEAHAAGDLIPDEAAAVAGFVPETGMLDDNTLDAALADKDALVFKTRASYGGDGVFIGADHDRATLDAALRARGPRNFIAQALLSTIPERAPLVAGGDPVALETVFGLYHYAGESAGMMVRASAGARVVNSSTGAKTGWSAQSGGMSPNKSA